jgi:hypothetical protein
LELQKKEELEIAAWKNSATEAPGVDSLENFVNKATDAAVFMEAVGRHRARFDAGSHILELGGGRAGHRVC